MVSLRSIFMSSRLPPPFFISFFLVPVLFIMLVSLDLPHLRSWKVSKN